MTCNFHSLIHRFSMSSHPSIDIICYLLCNFLLSIFNGFTLIFNSFLFCFIDTSGVPTTMACSPLHGKCLKQTPRGWPLWLESLGRLPRSKSLGNMDRKLRTSLNQEVYLFSRQVVCFHDRDGEDDESSSTLSFLHFLGLESTSTSYSWLKDNFVLWCKQTTEEKMMWSVRRKVRRVNWRERESKPTHDSSS